MSFTVKPNTGYVLDGVTIDGEAVEVTDNSFVASIRADAEVVITYKKAYRITAIVSEQGGGRITVDEPHTLENMFVYVAEGDRITFTFTPDMGYEIDYVKIDGSQVTLTSDNKYTITDVKKAYTISVVFKHTSSSSTTYSVYASAGANGSISPSGRQTVAEGASLTFTITPNTGYEVDYVQVDGTDVSLTDGKYEFKNIAGNHTINVYFKQAGTVSARRNHEGRRGLDQVAHRNFVRNDHRHRQECVRRHPQRAPDGRNRDEIVRIRILLPDRLGLHARRLVGGYEDPAQRRQQLLGHPRAARAQVDHRRELRALLPADHPHARGYEAARVHRRVAGQADGAALRL